MTPNTPVPERHVTLIAWLILAILVVISVAVFFAPHWFGGGGQTADPRGEISLTLTAASLTAPYIFNVETNELRPAERIAEIEPLRAVISSDGDMAYLCSGATSAVCVLDAQTGESRVVSKNAYPLKKYLSWSPDGVPGAKSVLYVAYVGTAPIQDSYSPFDWAVFLAKADGSREQRIFYGSHAVFSPDGASIFAMLHDGLHRFSLASSSYNALAWRLEGGSTNRFATIAISPDGKHLAWSSPNTVDGRGRVSLYSVDSWIPLAMQHEKDITLKAWQMKYSPNSSALALSADDAAGLPGLYIYKTRGTLEKVLDLQAYERKTYITDWQ